METCIFLFAKNKYIEVEANFYNAKNDTVFTLRTYNVLTTQGHKIYKDD